MYPRSNFLTIDSTCARVSQGGVGIRPAKNMLYSASSFFSSTSSCMSSRSILVGAATMLPGDEQPHERQPELPGIGHGAIVDQHFGVVGWPDNREQIAQPGGIRGPEPRAIAKP